MNYKLDDLFVYGDTWAFTHIPKTQEQTLSYGGGNKTIFMIETILWNSECYFTNQQNGLDLTIQN